MCFDYRQPKDKTLKNVVRWTIKKSEREKEEKGYTSSQKRTRREVKYFTISSVEICGCVYAFVCDFD